MSVTIDTSQVRAAGKSARDIGNGTVRTAKRHLNDAEDNAAGAKAGELDSKGSLDDVFILWIGSTGGLATTLETVGDKLVSTASTYEQNDDASADEFAYVRPEAGPHRDPNGGW